MIAASECDAHLDPWCAVPLETGETILFGYALHHAETGGLAWLGSSELLHLDAAVGRARTRSGRRYLLGRRFAAIDVGGEGEEARLAFQLLVGVDFEELDDLVEVDRRWLQAKKAARHLAVAPPARTDAATRAFFREHGAAYLAVMRPDLGRTS
jgi:hypothetical protein